MTTEAARPIDFGELIAEYARRYPKEMELLHLVGAYPGQIVEGRKNPYTQELDTEDYGNIGEHCIAVAFCAEIIADKVLLDKDSPLKERIIRSALVHDIGKPLEIMRRKAVEQEIIDDAYSRSAYLTVRERIAEQADVTPELADYIAHAGEETGHISFPDFIELREGKLRLKTEDNIAEMIVHLADDMTYSPYSPTMQAGETSKSYYVTVLEKQQLMDYPNRYAFLYTEGLGFDENGNVVSVKDISQPDPKLSHVKSLAEWHLWIAAEIAKYLVGKIDSTISKEDAEQSLKELVNASL